MRTFLAGREVPGMSIFSCFYPKAEHLPNPAWPCQTKTQPGLARRCPAWHGPAWPRSCFFFISNQPGGHRLLQIFQPADQKPLQHFMNQKFLKKATKKFRLLALFQCLFSPAAVFVPLYCNRRRFTVSTLDSKIRYGPNKLLTTAQTD